MKPILALLAALTLVATPVVRAQAPLPTQAERALFQRSHRTWPAEIPGGPKALSTQADVDVLEYDLGIWLDVPDERIEGSVAARFVATPAAGTADQLVLDLYANMEVTGVERDGTPLDATQWSHAGDVLTIGLSPAIADGDPPTEVRIAYRGQPVELGFGTLTFMTHGDPPQPLVFSMSEPFLARGWWPCKDVPDDKALVRVAVEAPSDLTVASNGLIESTAPGRAGYTVTTWSVHYPISTYLVSVSASNYVSWSDSYVSQDTATTMPVSNFALPEQETASRQDLSRTPQMIDAFAKLWGEYPFLQEKYGHAVVSMWGAMEHQTCTSIGMELQTGDNRYDFVVAHELGHQWWGDCVTTKTFDSIWLNEGFATYSEATWFETQYGLGTYLQYMHNMDPWPYGREWPGTVHAPLDYFNATVYDKGAWVLHMLRWVIGGPAGSADRESIDAVLRAHRAEHEYGNATTADFEATASRIAGQDLTWFFDEWVHREGRPVWEVGWAAAPQRGGGFVTHLRASQTQADLYRMPVLVRLTFASGATQDELVLADSRQQDWSWPTTEAPTSVQWDPDGWVLKGLVAVDIDADDDGWPDWLDDCVNVPDPGQEDADGNGTADACQAGLDYDGDGVLNENDCAPGDGQAWTTPLDVVLFVRKQPDGTATFDFTLPDAQGQRTPVVDLEGGLLDDLRTDGSTVRTTCVQRGLMVPWNDGLATVAGGGEWYLARTWNGCGERLPSGDWASPCR